MSFILTSRINTKRASNLIILKILIEKIKGVHKTHKRNIQYTVPN